MVLKPIMTDNDQIPLQFSNTRSQTFSSFEIGENQELVNSLQTFINSDSESVFYLYGGHSSGKTHLLNALISFSQTSGLRAVMVTPDDIINRNNISLVHMFDLICLDNLESVCGDEIFEEALFCWMNEVRQSHKKLVLSSICSNMDKKWKLPDLRSRLVSGRTHQLKALNRDTAWKVFLDMAEQKGIVLDDKISAYLQSNSSMNMDFLTRLLQRMDQITLAEKKQATVPLIRKILKSFLE